MLITKNNLLCNWRNANAFYHFILDINESFQSIINDFAHFLKPSFFPFLQILYHQLWVIYFYVSSRFLKLKAPTNTNSRPIIFPFYSANFSISHPPKLWVLFLYSSLTLRFFFLFIQFQIFIFLKEIIKPFLLSKNEVVHDVYCLKDSHLSLVTFDIREVSYQ
jgi:hypothetical protein